MKIAIVNTKNSNHTICTLSGQKIIIPPRDFTVLTLEEDRDILFWTGLDKQNVEKYGLRIVTNTADIIKLELSKNSGAFDTSIVDGFVSPVAKSIASVTSKKSTNTDTIINEISDTKDSVDVNTADPDNAENKNNNVEYTEEMLSSMDKEDLINLCDNFNIKYKKNNSVKTLVKLLLEAGV